MTLTEVEGLPGIALAQIGSRHPVQLGLAHLREGVPELVVTGRKDPDACAADTQQLTGDVTDDLVAGLSQKAT